MNVISYSWFAAQSWIHFKSTVSSLSFTFFFSTFMHTCMYIYVCMCVCAHLLRTTDSYQYSADKDRENERLGKNVNGNNKWAEFIQKNLTWKCCKEGGCKTEIKDKKMALSIVEDEQRKRGCFFFFKDMGSKGKWEMNELEQKILTDTKLLKCIID